MDRKVPAELREWARLALELYTEFEEGLKPLDQLNCALSFLLSAGVADWSESQRLLATRLVPWLNGSPLGPVVRGLLERLRDGEEVAPDEVPVVPTVELVESEPEGAVWAPDSEDGGDELPPPLRVALSVDTALDLAGRLDPSLFEGTDQLPNLLHKLFRQVLASDAEAPTVVSERLERARKSELAGVKALLALVDSAWSWYEENAEVPNTLVAPEGVVKPRRAQLAVAYLAQRYGRVLDSSDCGLGKTFGGLLALEYSHSRTALVVVHPSTYNQVLTDYERAFSNDPTTRVYSDWRKAVRRPAEALGGWRVVVVVRSSELSRDGVNKVQKLRERLGGELEFVLVDEAHGVKDGSANVTQAALEAVRTARVVLFQTGTPLVNNLGEVRQLLSAVADTQWKEKLEKLDGKPTLGNALVLRDCFTEYAVRVKNEEPLPKPRVHHLNHDGEDERLNELVLERRKALYGPNGPRVTASRLEECVFDLKAEWAVEFVSEKVADGHQVLVSTGAWVEGRLPQLAAQLRKKGLRVATYCGNDSREERDEVVRKVQRKELDVVVANVTGAVGVDGFQGDRNFEHPGRVSCFLEVVSHWTPATRDQHRRRVLRTRGKDGVVANVEFHTVQLWVRLPDPDNEGEFVLRSLENYRESVLARKEVLFAAVVDGDLPQNLLTQGLNTELFPEGGDLLAPREWTP